jgi:hypothetical protein
VAVADLNRMQASDAGACCCAPMHAAQAAALKLLPRSPLDVPLSPPPHVDPECARRIRARATHGPPHEPGSAALVIPAACLVHGDDGAIPGVQYRGALDLAQKEAEASPCQPLLTPEQGSCQRAPLPSPTVPETRRYTSAAPSAIRHSAWPLVVPYEPDPSLLLSAWSTERVQGEAQQLPHALTLAGLLLQ